MRRYGRYHRWEFVWASLHRSGNCWCQEAQSIPAIAFCLISAQRLGSSLSPSIFNKRALAATAGIALKNASASAPAVHIVGCSAHHPRGAATAFAKESIPPPQPPNSHESEEGKA